MLLDRIKKSSPDQLVLYTIALSIVFGLCFYFLFGFRADDTKTANWQTYRNDEYGFEFKYPKGWMFNNQSVYGSNHNSVSIISPEHSEMFKKVYEGEYYLIDFAVTVCDSINTDCARGGSWITMRHYDSVKDFFNDDSPDKIKQKSLFMSNVDVAGVRGYGFLVGGLGMHYEIMLDHNNKVYLLDFPSAENKLSPEQKEILSAFKFTNN